MLSVIVVAPSLGHLFTDGPCRSAGNDGTFYVGIVVCGSLVMRRRVKSGPNGRLRPLNTTLSLNYFPHFVTACRSMRVLVLRLKLYPYSRQCPVERTGHSTETYWRVSP